MLTYPPPFNSNLRQGDIDWSHWTYRITITMPSMDCLKHVCCNCVPLAFNSFCLQLECGTVSACTHFDPKQVNMHPTCLSHCSRFQHLTCLLRPVFRHCVAVIPSNSNMFNRNATSLQWVNQNSHARASKNMSCKCPGRKKQNA